jgi:hypothetical protein
MRVALLFVAAACARGNAPAEPRPIAWSAPIEIANGGGEKGPWQQNDSRFDYVDDPSVVLEPSGAADVVWVDHRTKDVHFQIFERDGTARLAKPVNISNTPAVFSWLPRIARSPARPKDLYVLWQEIVFSGGTHGGEIFFARSTDGGATWAAPANLSRSVNGDGKGRIDAKRWHNGSLDLAVAGDGTLYAAWTEYDGPLWLARSTDRGATFGSPVQVVAGAGEPARAPALAIAGDLVYLAWTVGENPAADVRVAKSTDRGATFGAPVIVEQTRGYSDAPKLVVDGAGTLHLVYAETEGGPFEPADVRYVRSRDRGATFESAKTIANSGHFPSLELDGDQLYVAWELDSGRGIGLAYSLDAGATFTAGFVVDGSVDAGTNGSHQGRLMRKLAVRDGTIAVVNSALRHDEGSRVWLMRGQLPARVTSRLLFARSLRA